MEKQDTYINTLMRQGYLHIGTHIMSVEASDSIKRELKNDGIEYFTKLNSHGVWLIKLKPVVEKTISKRSKKLADEVNVAKRDLINGRAVYFGKCIRSNKVAQTIIYDFNTANISYSIRSNSYGVTYIKLC